jgi:hypothetical protein
LLQSEKPLETNTNLLKTKKDDDSSLPSTPIISLSSNFRPLKAQNGRIIRTNINIKLKVNKIFLFIF